jgi:DNA-binding PadR family transcriptional regulator
LSVSAVFSHGRLRLYLLKLLAEGPRHGYELIRLLSDRFLGRYAPSAGTIYPRLQAMEAAGLVTHTAVGGRKIYELTHAGRAELVKRAVELRGLEAEVDASVAGLMRDTGQAAELERLAAQLMFEAQRVSRTGRASLHTVRAVLTVLDRALDQVRRLAG